MKTYVLPLVILLSLVSHSSQSVAQIAISESATCVNDTWTRLTLPASIPAGLVFGFGLALWTGKEVIFWVPGVQGFRYDPSTGIWTPINRSGQPGGGLNWFNAFWIDNEMIIVGGGGNSNGVFSTVGARYHPATDTWTPINTTNSPTYPAQYVAVWTGTEILVWAGATINSPGPAPGGARYNPATDSWTPISRVNAPRITRSKFSFPNPVGVWNGTELLILGVNYLGPFPEYEYISGRYNPATDTWRTLNTSGAPEPREGIHAIWTGTEMIAWQGAFLAARYNPISDSWRSMDRFTMSPSLQDGAEVVVWTGTEMLAWGNRGDSRGGKYHPSTDTWTPMSAIGDPGGGVFAGAWTGQQLVAAGTVEPIGGPSSFPAAASYCDLVGYVPPCPYSLSAGKARFTSVGGIGTVNLTTQPHCNWTATSNASWVTITSATLGTGNTVIGYSVSPDTDPSLEVRTASLAVGTAVLRIVQSGPPSISSVTASGKNLIVTGLNFDDVATVLVDGTPQRTRRNEQDPRTLIGKKSAKQIPSGTTAAVQVQNGDGALSHSYSFFRP